MRTKMAFTEIAAAEKYVKRYEKMAIMVYLYEYITPCSLVDMYQILGRNCCLLLQVQL
jgi:hypothetical protein